MHFNTENLKGQKFGRLLVLKPTEKRSGTSVVWLCRCDCGNIREATAQTLKRKKIKSCGCLQKEIGRKARLKNLKHGDRRRGENINLYNIWCSMKQRCFYHRASNFRWYGKKGIKICPEWKNNYPVFKQWALANGYKEGLTIDRINPNGNYEPSNCQWITLSENVKKSKRDIAQGVL